MQFQEVIDNIFQLISLQLNNSTGIQSATSSNTYNHRGESKLRVSDREDESRVTSSLVTNAPPWSWICESMIKLLLDNPEGITGTIAKSDIFRKWELECMDRSVQSITAMDRSILPNIGSYFRKNDIPYDMVVDGIVADIKWNDRDQATIRLGSPSNPTSSKLLDVYIHPKYNQYILVNNNNNNNNNNNIDNNQQQQTSLQSLVIRIGSRVRMTGITTSYPTNPQLHGYGQMTILSPENMSIVLDEVGEDASTSITCDSKYFNMERLNQIMRKQQNPQQQQQIEYPPFDSIFLLRVDKINDESPIKITDEVKWNNCIAYDRHTFDYLLKQTITLSDPYSFEASQLFSYDNSNNSNGMPPTPIPIQLIFWDNLCRSINLLKQGDIIVLQYIYFNHLKSNTKLLVFEYTQASTMFIIPNQNQMKQNVNYFNQITNNNLDMSLYLNRLSIGDLKVGMTNVSLVARVLNIAKMKYENNTSKTPILISDGKGDTFTLLLFDDLSKLISMVWIGQLCWFTNLYVLEIEGKNRLCASNDANSAIQPLSTIEGLMNSKFLYKPISSISQIPLYNNCIVKARIVEYILLDEFPIYAYHKVCKRLLKAHQIKNNNSSTIIQFTCSHCQIPVEESQMEKIFNMGYRIVDINSNSSNPNNNNQNSLIVTAFPTLNRKILRVNEKQYTDSTMQDRKRYLSSILNCDFTLSISKTKQDKTGAQQQQGFSFTIDGFISKVT